MSPIEHFLARIMVLVIVGFSFTAVNELWLKVLLGFVALACLVYVVAFLAMWIYIDLIYPRRQKQNS